MKLFNKNIILAAASISLMSCTPIYKKMNVDKETYEGLNDGLYANLQTTKGNLIVKFEDKKAPVTVANFIGLAEGKIDNKAKAKGVPFYDGTIFHRVIKDFMIQGGCPNTKAGETGVPGTGGPGYKIKAEFNERSHQKGVLSMARSADPNAQRQLGRESEVPQLACAQPAAARKTAAPTSSARGSAASFTHVRTP